MMPEYSSIEENDNVYENDKTLFIDKEDLKKLNLDALNTLKKVLTINNTEKYKINDIKAAMQKIVSLQSANTQISTMGMRFRSANLANKLSTYDEVIKFLREVLNSD